MTTHDFEKLGQFYLGRRYDATTQRATDELLLYDSQDLVTHALCVGMTGSGKTGLCVSLIEEATIDGVPALIIDPKGDLPNLLLTFPRLAPEDFEPWLDEGEAQRTGRSRSAFASEQAAKWKEGLAAWGLDGERIARLKSAAEFTIYTPGSTAGIPLSLLKSFAPPGPRLAGDSELLSDRIQTTATSLLGLIGVEGDPIRSREHVLLSTILQSAWTQGRSLTLPDIIQRIQSPPVTRVGIMDVEAFFPARDRFPLAMAFNNLLAAPGFELWMQGDPLDVDRLLHTAEGKPRVSICSIAHLSDAERMFFVSLLLNEVVGWMRSQSGTTSLRAIVYMDEIAGYFPPVSNPPSKAPLLTLLKQARATGIGIVLATQNPVDLDYKGLSNCGTWFLGRLQTARDKARVLDGLEGAATATGRGFDRQWMEQALGGLPRRVFLLHNVHEPAPVLFESRWAMSYLRGPLGRDEIRRLTAAAEPADARPSPEPPGVVAQVPPPAPPPVPQPGTAAHPPMLPHGVEQYFLPASASTPTPLRYLPMVYGAAQWRCVDAKLKIDAPIDLAVITPIVDGPVPVDWDASHPADVAPADLERSPAAGGTFGEVPARSVTAKSVDAWSKAFAKWVSATESIELLRADHSGLVSQPGESERDFRIRLQQASREGRDAMVEKLRRKFASRVAAAQERVRRAEQALQRETEQAQAQSLQTAISFGTTLLGAFMGRKAVTAATLGRATTAARGVGRTLKDKQDVGRAREAIAAAQQQLRLLDDDLHAEIAAVEAQFNAASEPLTRVACRPKKTNVDVRLVALVWKADHSRT